MSTRIFISYSRSNSDFAHRLEVGLKECGFQVWLDTDELQAGQFWREQIVEAIEICDFFVLLLSSRSIVSENVVRELSLAESSSKPILPVMLEEVEIPNKMKYQLAGLQFALVESAQIDQAIAALLSVLPTPESEVTASAPAGDRPLGETLSSMVDSFWDKAKLLDQLLLAIGPMASVLLESLPDLLRNQDRDTLQALFEQHKLDRHLLDEALASAVMAAVPEPSSPEQCDGEIDASLVVWLRLQLGPIAELILDKRLIRELRDAPSEAIARLERLGVEPRVVEELLRRTSQPTD